MAKTNNSVEFNSPSDELFTWATPSSDSRNLGFSKGIKCYNDSGYNSVSPSCVSISLNENRSGETSDVPDGSGFISREPDGIFTPAIKGRTECFKKRLLLQTSQDEKASEHIRCSTVGELDSYSEYLMETSLYNEPVEISMLETSQLDVVSEESLDMCEISKKITVDSSMDISSICSEPITPLRRAYEDRLFKTPLKKTLTSPRKKKILFKKRIHRPKFLKGSEKIDILYQLGEMRNYIHVAEKILDNLPGKDLSNVTMVSKSWRNICLGYPKAMQRWQNYVSKRKEMKENLLNCSEGKQKLVGTPLLTRNHSTPLQTRQPSSPPVSPSKVRFHLFQKEAMKLKQDEILMSCPSCSLPSTCSPSTRLGKCSRAGCGMEFCSTCRSPYHGSRPCVTSTPISPYKPKRTGSKESKRLLRRL